MEDDRGWRVWHGEVCNHAKDGSVYWVDTTIVPFKDDEGRIRQYVAVRTDITDRKHTENLVRQRTREALLLNRAGEASGKAESVRDALQACVTLVCEALDWSVGHVYVPAEDGTDELKSADIWCLADDLAFTRFVEVTRRTQFGLGEGLPGRILRSGNAAWIVDVQKDENFPRAKLCSDLGVRGAFGFPVKVRGKTVAVLEFFSREAMEPDDHLLQTVTLLGQQLGRIFERREADERLRDSNQELAATTGYLEATRQEAEAKAQELERFNTVMVGRETRVLQLKREVNALLLERGRKQAYADPEADDTTCVEVGEPRQGTPEQQHPLPFGALRDVEVVDNARLEKRRVKVAFIPIVCSAPLIYAHSHGFFARHGLDVSLSACAGWSGIKELLVYGHTDAAHMLTPMPLACSLGIDGKQADIRLAAIQNINGQALTLAAKHEGIRHTRDMKGFTFGVPYRFSMQNYLLCKFLADAGLNPLEDVEIIEVSPPRMPYFLEKGWVDGVFAPEPFNQISVRRGIGVIHTLSKDIWNGHPCCSFATTQRFIDEYPNTYHAMLQSVLEAQLALHRADSAQRSVIAAELAVPAYLNAPAIEPVEQALSGHFPDGRGNECCESDYLDFDPHPWPAYGTWILTQMQRWGQLPRRVDYQRITQTVFMGGTTQLAESIGFEKDASPSFDERRPADDASAFEDMRKQAFCAFSETSASPDTPSSPSIEERLEDLLPLLAKAVGGLIAPNELVAKANHPLTVLEQMLSELLANHRFSSLALQEQKEQTEQRVAEQTESLRASNRAVLGLLEDTEIANRAKSEFLANMSHEIRTPMTAILGFAENMLAADQSDSERLNCVHTIRRNGEHLLGLINDILDLSKIEAGKMSVERGNCHPCHVIAEVASLMRVRADAKGLPLNIEYIGAIPETIHSDATRLRQILINLIGNAIKFTEIGAVRLVTRFVDDGDESCLQFDVIDTGRGMTPEQVAKLFQPFVQADNSTTRKFGGTGLGLTISRRLAELLGGDITVADAALGVGSTFRVTLATGPLDGVKMLDDPMSATVVSDNTGTVAQVLPSDLHGLRIMLAEDGPDNQRLIAFVLKKAGADVTVVENGKLALDAALAARDEGEPFDCILMDMQMPVMDGYEATGHLRQKGYAAPIIALTAHAMASDREKCIRAGCDDYATKPIDRRKLIETIQQHVQHAVPAGAAAT